MTDREFNWDDIIENDSTFELLPDGDYEFEVTKFTRGRYEGGAKIGPCPKAILELTLNTEKGTRAIEHNLLLHSKMEGFLCEFFTAIGQRNKGESLKMNWAIVTGAKGRLKLGTRTWKGNNGEDRKSNEVKKFYEAIKATPTFVVGDF